MKNKHLITEKEGYAKLYKFEFNTPKDNYTITLFGRRMDIFSEKLTLVAHGDNNSPIEAISMILLHECGDEDFKESVLKGNCDLNDFYHYNNFKIIYKSTNAT